MKTMYQILNIRHSDFSSERCKTLPPSAISTTWLWRQLSVRFWFWQPISTNFAVGIWSWRKSEGWWQLQNWNCQWLAASPNEAINRLLGWPGAAQLLFALMVWLSAASVWEWNPGASKVIQQGRVVRLLLHRQKVPPSSPATHVRVKCWLGRSVCSCHGRSCLPSRQKMSKMSGKNNVKRNYGWLHRSPSSTVCLML